MIFTTWDRFSRNLSDAIVMIDKLANNGIELIAVQQPIDLSIPQNKLFLAIYLSVPEIENTRKQIILNQLKK